MADPAPLTEAEKKALIAGFTKFFEPTSERGAALSAVSDLDAVIGACLKSVMVKDEKAINVMFGEQGFLNAFGAKIRFAYLFGLISKNTNDELLIINKIRNHFAHVAGADSFKFPKIQGWTSSLKILQNPIDLVPYISSPYPSSASDGMVWSIFAHSLELANIDIRQPNWAFVMEVSIFVGCFKRIAEDKSTKILMAAPWF